MSTHIYWILEVAIKPDQLNNFRALARDLIANTRPETGTLAYEWNISADGTSCHIYERYANGAALVAHVQGFHAFAERFMQACEPTRFTVYGTPDAAVKEILADFHPTYYSLLGGFAN